MTKASATEGYVGKNGDKHNAGSIKGDTHRIYDTDGRDAAIKYVAKKGLQDATARVWISSWKPKEKSARRAPAKAAKAAPARKAAVKGKTSAKRPSRTKAKVAKAAE